MSKVPSPVPLCRCALREQHAALVRELRVKIAFWTTVGAQQNSAYAYCAEELEQLLPPLASEPSPRT